MSSEGGDVTSSATGQPLLQLALGGPGPFERHGTRRFKKDCIEVGAYHKPFLALVHKST